MEKNQNVQQPSQVQVTTSQPQKSKSAQTGSKNLVIYLLTYYPWVFLIGLSVIFVLCAVLAFYSLSSVESVEQTKLEEQDPLIAEVEQPTNTQSETDNSTENTNPISLWMVAAIALSCASGCLIIFRWLNRPAQYQKVHKQKNRYQARQAKRQRLESLPPKNQAIVLQPQPQTPMMSPSTATKPVVTVLPPNPNSSKTNKKESLAGMLDIRKETSLSAILRN